MQAAVQCYLFFVCDRPNYARWGTYYVLDMVNNLPPKVLEAFRDGQHSVSLTSGFFKKLYTDIAVEMTVVRDTKDKRSGIIGYSRKEKARLLWGLLRNTLGRYARVMRERFGQGSEEWSEEPASNHHEQESKAFLTRDEEHVSAVLHFIRTCMTDPFSASGRQDRLIHIGNGPCPPKTIQDSLLNARATGQKQLEEFVKRLETDPENRTIKFYASISKSGLKTFSDLNKPTPIRVNGKIVSHKVTSGEVVLQRILELLKVRGLSVNLKDILNCLNFPFTSPL